MDEKHEEVVKQITGEEVPEEVAAEVSQFEVDMEKLGGGTQIPRLVLLQIIHRARIQSRLKILEGTVETLVKSLATPAGQAALRAKAQMENRK